MEHDETATSRLHGQVVCFVSAKGGSGKTLITATAAYLLTQADKKVLCIDTDFSTRGLSLYLIGRETASERRIELKEENCLSDALAAELRPDQVQPWKVIRHGRPIDLLVSSLLAWTKNRADDRIVGEGARGNISLALQYYEYLKTLLAYFRKQYDYILIDTRGGYDFTSAAPAILSDGYVVVLEADQISVQQVFGLKVGIEEWAQRHGAEASLTGFVVNKATYSGDNRLFTDSLINLYGGSHYGTIPLDVEAVRAYQVREIPTELRPDSEFAFHSYASLERLFSPS